MILYDTGYIVAALVRTDAWHTTAVKTLKRQSAPLVTTWPCLTEAMYLTTSYGGQTAREGLFHQIKRGFFRVVDLSHSDTLRICDLMQQYADIPMDFADASLVVAAEKFGITKILTFDRHFYAYRINGNNSFEVVT